MTTYDPRGWVRALARARLTDAQLEALGRAAVARVTAQKQNAAAPRQAGRRQPADTAKETSAMTTVQKHPLEVEVGDVITAHPHAASPVWMRVTAPPVRLICDQVQIDYKERGRRGVLVVDQHTTVTVRTTYRRDVIAGLRALADRLEAEPYLPVGRWSYMQYTASQGRCPQDAVREVDRVARILGVTPRWRGDDYVAEADFGPVQYVAVALKAKEARS